MRQQKDLKTTTKIVESLSDKDAEKVVDIIGVADKLLEKISEMLSAEVTNAQGIKNLTSALKDLKDVKGFKSELDKQEQEARIAKLRREAGLGDDEEDGGGVIVLPDATAPLIDEEDVGE